MLTNLGAAQVAAGRQGDAVNTLERALRIKRRLLGASHPDNLAALQELGNAQLVIDPIAAERAYDEVLAMAPALSLAQLGEAQALAGDQQGARENLERALTLYEKRLGPDHDDVQEIRRALAAVRGRQD